MISYLAILGAALGGLGGLQPWIIAASAIALASLSYTEHSHLYDRGHALGLSRLVNTTLLKSFGNGLLASGGAYGIGWVLRLL